MNRSMVPGAALLSPFHDSTKAAQVLSIPEASLEWLRGVETNTMQKIYKEVSWLFRCVNIRATTFATIPFVIHRKGNPDAVIDSSENYQNVVKFLPDPAKLLTQFEASLLFWSGAYFHRRMQGSRLLLLRYIPAEQLRPNIKADAGLVSLIRTVNSREYEVPIENYVYFWQADAFTEIGPPAASPVASALADARVIWSVNQAAATYFENGMIKATILGVDGGVGQGEAQKLESWFKRFMSRGLSSQNEAKVLNTTKVNVHTVGDGLEALSDADLVREKREAIATGLDVPHSLVFSNAANFATEEADKKRFIAGPLMSDARFFAGTLNMQVLHPLGLHIVFDHRKMELFAEDEKNAAEVQYVRSQTFQVLVGAGLSNSAAAQISKLELPDEMTAEQLDRFEQPAEPSQNTTEAEKRGWRERLYGLGEKERTDLLKYSRKAIAALKKGEAARVFFDSLYIHPARLAAVDAQLEKAKTAQDVKAIFADVLNWTGKV